MPLNNKAAKIPNAKKLVVINALMQNAKSIKQLPVAHIDINGFLLRTNKLNTLIV